MKQIPEMLSLTAMSLIVFAGCGDTSYNPSTTTNVTVPAGAPVTVNPNAPTNPTTPTTPTNPGTFTVIATDPSGGVIRESADGSMRTIAGTFSQDVTMTNAHTWVLDAPVIFGDDAGSATPTLNISAGTTILGRGGTPPSMLVIKRNAKIMALGERDSPIVFTSAQAVGSRAPGDWGGIVINGNAPVNVANPLGEGGSGPYGGNNPTDNSGTLRYVRVEYAGRIFTSDDELNGIAFQGVGSGTTVEFIQVHRNADDGVEFFGGTVNVKNVVLTGNLDDSLDWTNGWTGRAQFVVIQQYPGGADNGIEADNLGTDQNALPRSKPTLSNFTIIGPAAVGEASDLGLLLRRGTGGNLHNFIIQGMNEYALDIDDTSTFDNAYSDAPTYTVLSGELTLINSFFFDNNLGNFRDDAGDPQTDSNFSADNGSNQNMDPQIVDPQNLINPNFLLQAASPALTAGVTPSDNFFTTINYVGAFNSTDDWTTNASGRWITTSQN